MPFAANARMTCSMKGRFPTGSMTLDLVWVSGLHLRPSPAANMTPFKSITAGNSQTDHWNLTCFISFRAGMHKKYEGSISEMPSLFIGAENKTVGETKGK